MNLLGIYHFLKVSIVLVLVLWCNKRRKRQRHTHTHTQFESGLNHNSNPKGLVVKITTELDFINRKENILK